ncbi:MAG TPA: hypothetical protein VHT91_27785 [Kofleriaceae bacterium]|nr:hypothetical protein [Kofleriaceae bacterium]
MTAAMTTDTALDRVTTTLRGLSTLEWVVLIIVVIAVLAIAIAGFVWWRRRRAAHGDAAPEAPAGKPATAPLGKQLVADVRRFRRGLPAVARRNLDAFHPIVVLGTEASGKAAIIERFAGIAQRRVELGPSAEATGGPLRCLLGTEVVVFDPSEDVVRAPRELVSAGLTRALAPALRRRPPIVVVCVSPEVLDKQTEPQLAELGSALRARLDVLAALRDEPCSVRVVLSDVPGYQRFDALFRLLQLPGMPAVLPIDRVDGDAVRDAMLAYADEIGTALVQLAPHETLELVGFLEAVPQLASALAVLLGELFAPAGELTPRPDGLYLLPAQGGPNPLVVPEALLRPSPSPLLKHRLIAVSLAVAGGAALLAAYQRDAERWDHAAAAATSYELKGEREIDLRLAIRTYTAGAQGLTDRLSPGFFVQGPAVVACSFAEQIRQDALISSITAVLATPPDKRRTEHALYTAALLYAGHGNALDRLVEDRLDDWAAATDLPSSLILDYLHMARPYPDDRWIERLRDVTKAPTLDPAADSLARLLGLLAPGRAWTPSDIAEVTALAGELRPELRERALFGATAQILSTPPLDGLRQAFEVHAAHFALLADLWNNRIALDQLLATVAEAVPADATGEQPAPRSFTELAAALASLLAPPNEAPPTKLAIAGHPYVIDSARFLRAVRGGDVERVVAGFVERMSGADAQPFFPDPAQWKDVGLAIQWPAGTSGAETHARRYQRESFENEVKPAVLATHKLVDQLADLPAIRDQLAQVLAAALDRYAAGYEQELERLIGSFRVEMSSEVAAQRILRVLAGARSPMRELLSVVAHDADLGLANDKTGLFDAMAAVEDRFGALAALFAAAKPAGKSAAGGDAFVAYQDALRALAAALGSPPAAAAPAARPGARPAAAKPGASDAAPGAAGPGAAAEALTARLSPAGALALAVATGAPDSPLAGVDTWLADKPLTDELAAVFRMPVRAVHRLGARDVEAALAGWDRDIEASVDADLRSRFPFDRRSGDDVDPQTLTAWLQPKRGRLAADLEPAVAGLVVQARGWDGHPRHRPAQPCTGDEVCVRVPGALLATLDCLAAVSDLLWDDAGKPRPLEVEVTPRPFTLAGGEGPIPELIRLTVGETSLFYFNQRPRRSALAIDWARDQTATLSVQLKQDGSLSLTPPAVAASGTPWSLFHLLQQAERRGSTYTWHIRLGASQILTVSYDVVDRTAQGFCGARALVSRGPR